jgi:catechol 2,3-dioxygenase-like lactoylglutathione lyase family enzyme
MADASATKPAPQYRTPAATVPAPRIRGVHHTAWRCRDAAETRWFYETVCGLELEAALAFKEAPGSGLPLRYMHLFFKMGDGNFVAFFDIPDSAKEEYFKQRSGFNLHFAMEVDTMAELETFKQRWQDHGLEVYGPLDHHFVHSIYTYDPNGIQVEITCKTPIYDAYMADERAQNDKQMNDWQAETAEAKEGRLRISPVAKGAMAAE